MDSNFRSQRASRIVEERKAFVGVVASSETTRGVVDLWQWARLKTLFNKLSEKFSFGQKRRKRPEYSILISVLLLIAIGTLTLYAIGPAVLKRTGGGLGRQSLFILIGTLGMIGAYKFKRIDLLVKYAPYIFALAIILCAALLIPGVGKVVYGGRRWIELGPFTMQPSEFVKFALVFFMSGMAVYFKQSTLRTNTQVLYLLSLMGLVAFFVLILQRDLGTTLVLSTIALFILIGCGVSRAVIVKLALLGVLGLMLGIMMFGYRRERLLSFLNLNSGSNNGEQQVETASDYHLRQSLIAIGSGGIYGRGVGKSVQSFGYLPEAPSDSIFAVYAEKFGFLGSLAILSLFVVLVKKLLEMMQGLELYWRGVIAGTAGWVVGNFVVNMGSSLGLIPFTGVPLPFFSLGGSSLIIMLFMMGIALNISTYKNSRNRLE